MTYEKALEKLGLNPDIRLRQMFELGKLAAPTVQEPVATKLKTEQFNCFHVSAEDFKNLKALPVGTKLYTTTPAQPPIPDAITDNSESVEYKAGWNECRELTIQMRKS
jgi:hypothetical protein